LRVEVNGGALRNSSQRYATGAVGAAAFVADCRSSGTPFPPYVSRGDVRGGSILGPMTAARLGVETVDVGIPALALDSIREFCAVGDPGHLVRARASFLRSSPGPRGLASLQSESDQEISVRTGNIFSGKAARIRIRRQWA